MAGDLGQDRNCSEEGPGRQTTRGRDTKSARQQDSYASQTRGKSPNPPYGGGEIPRGSDDLPGPTTDNEGMETPDPQIFSLLVSTPVLLATVVLTLALLSGVAARLLTCVEELGHRWDGRSCLRRSTKEQYGTHVRAELKNIR